MRHLAGGGRWVAADAPSDVFYGQALVAYRARKFNQAKALSGHALEVDEGDGPSRRLFGLCAQFEVYPPPEGWDGVSELENQELKS